MNFDLHNSSRKIVKVIIGIICIEQFLSHGTQIIKSANYFVETLLLSHLELINCSFKSFVCSNKPGQISSNLEYYQIILVPLDPCWDNLHRLAAFFHGTQTIKSANYCVEILLFSHSELINCSFKSFHCSRWQYQPVVRQILRKLIICIERICFLGTQIIKSANYSVEILLLSHLELINCSFKSFHCSRWQYQPVVRQILRTLRSFNCNIWQYQIDENLSYKPPWLFITTWFRFGLTNCFVTNLHGYS